MTTELDQTTADFIVNMGLARGVVHGGEDDTVNTEGGPVDSLAKTIKGIKTDFEAGVGGIFDTVVGGYAQEAKAANTEVADHRVAVESAAALVVEQVENFHVSTEQVLAAAEEAIGAVGEIYGARDAARQAVTDAQAVQFAYEDRVYPGVYSTAPTNKPHSGLPSAEGDKCTLLVGGVAYEHLRSGGGWVIPNVDAAALALTGGAARVGFQASGTGAVARNLQDVAREFVSVLSFYHPADGTDYGAALGRAVDASPYVRWPAPPAGVTYRVTAATSRVLSRDVVINFEGNEVIFDGGYLRFEGQSIATGRTLAVNAPRYATSLTLDSGSDIQPGDLVYMTTGVPVETSWKYTKKDLIKVKSVSGASVELEEPIQFSYTTDDEGLAIAIRRPARLTLIRPKFKLQAVAGQAMFELRYLHDIDIQRPMCAGERVDFDRDTSEDRRMFQVLGCWNLSILDLVATAMSYAVLVVGASRNTEINGYRASFCNHAGEASDWAKGFYVNRLRASDCYSAVSAHPAFDVRYQDVIVERDAALSNLRCVRGALERARIHTLANDADVGPYFHNLQFNPGFEYLYQDADLTLARIEIVSPNRTLASIGCARARELRVSELKAVGFQTPVIGGISQVLWGAGNTINGKSTPTLGPLDMRTPLRTTENPMLACYTSVEGGNTIYHVDARRAMVDQTAQYLRCYGPVAQGVGGEPAVLRLRIHTHCFGSSATIAAVIGALKLKASVRHTNNGSFSYQEKLYNFYQKVTTASAVMFPTTELSATTRSGQALETIQISIANPTQAGAEIGGNADYWVQVEVSISSGRTSPLYALAYELELQRD